MAILVDKIQRGNPLRPEDPKKWYVSAKSIGTITEKEVARQVANRTALNRKEVEMAFALFRETLLENLLNGYTVRMSDWGYFVTTVNSDGSDTRDEAVANKVKRVRVHHRHDKSFENELQQATFITVDSLTKKETNP